MRFGESPHLPQFYLSTRTLNNDSFRKRQGVLRMQLVFLTGTLITVSNPH
jgi:hypothetical protein